MPINHLQHTLYHFQFCLLRTHKDCFYIRRKFYGLILTCHLVLMVGQTD